MLRRPRRPGRKPCYNLLEAGIGRARRIPTVVGGRWPGLEETAVGNDGGYVSGGGRHAC